MSLVRSTLMLAWMAGIMLGIGIAKHDPQWPLIIGGSLMFLVVIYGFLPMIEGRPKKPKSDQQS